MERVHNAYLFGADGVGKSSLISAITGDEDHDVSERRPNIETTYYLTLRRCGVNVFLDAIDTSSKILCASARRIYFKKADLLILVYDLNDDSSFQVLKSKMREIRCVLTVMPPLLVVGTKTDICDPSRKTEQVIQELTVNIEWEAKFAKVSVYNMDSVQNIRDTLFDILSSIGQEQEHRQQQSLKAARSMSVGFADYNDVLRPRCYSTSVMPNAQVDGKMVAWRKGRKTEREKIRKCSISERMKPRQITLEDLDTELDDIDGFHIDC
ncbi:hypothetical protein CAPTEDRAFT_200334 [Capitella teleta]|uniref:Uncharacterized protein n=1 Tax=Capitella teleta TaxID=283909 RepID=R7UTE9_CAPTE|nr:hypothetical protein CAPTEDRAFT_200334 [Capitella teleta]|eukprot:ELU09465.1 hypothetical protein CAPTEDRAFT_200334 [Capitella teleta]